MTADRLDGLQRSIHLPNHVQVLGQIPVDGELTVPKELFTESERQLQFLTNIHISKY